MYRIGNGYDVHRLIKGRKLILGGVDIPHGLGLDGHSDADVLCHALCDSLLGASGAGDLGKHFPDTDNKWKGVSSLVLLEKSVNWSLSAVSKSPILIPPSLHNNQKLARILSR